MENILTFELSIEGGENIEILIGSAACMQLSNTFIFVVNRV